LDIVLNIARAAFEAESGIKVDEIDPEEVKLFVERYVCFDLRCVCFDLSSKSSPFALKSSYWS
jgi:hypothetical protein